MIKGSLKDISLAGMLQLLANQAVRSYRIKVERAGQQGDLIVSNGYLISANYGLLRGEDAVCEFMSWDDGAFSVERLPPRMESSFDRNINLRLQQPGSFSDQAAFLVEDNVGLNTTIRPSKIFGTPDWQESSKLQPLQREDFLILGWLSDGRTMRQAMREFAFDLIQATGILYRLVLTRSVEVVRAGVSGDLTPAVGSGLFGMGSHASFSAPPQPLPENVAAAEAEAAPVSIASFEQTFSDGSAAVSGPVSAIAPPLEPVVHEVRGEPDILISRNSVGDERNSRRTILLPIISIDIERLLTATFSVTEFGFLALKNPSLDDKIRQIMLSVQASKTLEDIVASSERNPASVLTTIRYCLERGYIANADPVLPLTADLLLGRTELDQYLLQRRRVTGEQLRDLTEAARDEGVKLEDMLVKSGFLSGEDLENVKSSKTRFAMG